MRHAGNGHSFIALASRGAILPPQFLLRVAALKATQQDGTDYGLSKSLNLKDEIARYWRIANDLFNAYQERRERSDIDRAKVGVDEWLVPLMRDVFGYKDLAPAKPIELGERRFPITHHALEGDFPFVLTTKDADLDRADARFGDDGRRRAPHNLMQELLNASDSQRWGAISNGTSIRLLRDNASIARPAYIQADLQQIFQEQLYSDFAALWLLIHSSRLRAGADGPPAILETWRAQANEEGERALGQLRDGVTQALLSLGNGFLEHPANERLRVAIADSSLTPDALFQELLRLVYRLLFLFAAEERQVLHPGTATGEQRDLYRDGFALARLRDRALRRRHYDRHADLWTGLLLVFRGLADGQPAIGLPALGGLFSLDQCSHLDAASVSNARLLEAVRALAYFRTEGGLTLVNYRDMGAEELGSVYESLLELHPLLLVDVTPWSFDLLGKSAGDSTKGSVRKLTGSYYTPTQLVNELIKTTLEPVMAAALQKMPNEPRQALLNLKVLDPACGSGHFLLASARRIAAEIARVSAASDTPDETTRQHALREVVQHCIHGVDRNPLAVELCKVALWIETVEPGRPLSFLDAHIQCGDSLVGLLKPDQISGIPDDAYKRLTGDDAVICRELKRKNRATEGAVQGSLFDQTGLRSIAEGITSVDAMPEDTPEQIAHKRQAWEGILADDGRRLQQRRADLLLATFFAPKNREKAGVVPLTEDLNRLDRAMASRPGVDEFVDELAGRYRFLHWDIAFAEIMKRGGFDIVIGNPPWEVSQFREEEYFAARAPSIARLVGNQRKIAIAQLAASNPSLWREYQAAVRSTEATTAFVHESGRFPLTARGKLNLYALFAETFLNLLSPSGRAGLIVPAGLLSDEPTMFFFQHITGGERLSSAISFENEEFIFTGIANVVRFTLLTLSGAADPQRAPRYAFYLRRLEQLNQSDRYFSVTPNDLALLNPNTKTSPIFRSIYDADLTKRIYSRIPVLVNDADTASGNPWALQVVVMFAMNEDSDLFREREWFVEHDAQLDDMCWRLDDEQTFIPLYEAKYVWLYDHRFGSYHNLGKVKGRGGRGLPPVSDAEHADPHFRVQPRYWISKADVDAKLDERKNRLRVGWRDVTSAKLERTVVPCVLPSVGAGHTLPLFFTHENAPKLACLVANLSSIVLDYAARQKIGGTHLTSYIFKQLPVLPPSSYDASAMEFIVARVVELTYTALDVTPFARAAGYEGAPFAWEGQRRATLSAELDAYFARLYGLSRDELRFILDPSDVLGPSYPSETFRVLKEREVLQYGEYRTGRLVLEAWDRLDQQTHRAAASSAARA